MELKAFPSSMKRTSKKLLSLIALGAVVLGGCQTAPQSRGPESYVEGDYLIARSYDAADRLIEQLRKFNPDDNVLVATFTDINDLNASSPFGRMSAELIASRLSQHGMRILDVKLRKEDIFIQPSEATDHPGEFMLSRKLQEGISSQHDVSAVVVGTYSSSRFGQTTHVNVRVLKADDGAFLAAHNYSLENSEILSLLQVANRF